MPADDARSGASSSASTVATPAPAASADKQDNKAAVRTQSAGAESEKFGGRHTKDVHGKRVLTGRDAETRKRLGVCFPTWKKWWIITVIFIVQLSMNMNTGIYANGVKGIATEYGISQQAARVGQAVFLVAYAFGSELWAPWSEELGRRPIMQLSLFLVNVFQLPCALAPNFGSIVVGRILGGLSSAGGSVTLGMVADMWEAEDQEWPLAYVVFSSVGGSSIGPIVGPFVEAYLDWRWVFWVQLIFGGAVQLIHLFLVPETRSSVLLDREAKRLRKEGEDVWGPNEVKEKRFTMKGILVTWYRPFEFLAREPIVLCCSLLSGFSDALIFTFIESFQLVYEQWGFEAPRSALTFVPIWIGYIICYASMAVPIIRFKRMRRNQPDKYTPEHRLWWLLFTAPLEPIGLYIFAFTTYGPNHSPPIPYIAPMIASVLVAIANYAIYYNTIDYMVAAYGPYSASATGGNAFMRNGLAGIATMYSTPMFENLGFVWASFLLACLGVLVVIPIVIFYYKGEVVRRNSKFAGELLKEREGNDGHRAVQDEEDNGDIAALHRRKNAAQAQNEKQEQEQ